MPIKKVKERIPSQQRDLLDRLVKEFKEEGTPEPRPRIIVEGEEKEEAGPIHIFVLWEEWCDLSLRDRSKLILEAYRKTADPSFVPRVTAALGLTEEEAPNFGIDVQQFPE